MGDATVHLTSLASRIQGRRDLIRQSVVVTRSTIRQLEWDIEELDLVAVALRALLDAEVLDAVKVVETLQTEGLRTVFHDQDISVRAEVEELRGKISVNLVTHQVKDGQIIEGASIDGFGGAVSTVQSILLRLIVIRQRGLRPVLFLDETLPAFDDRYVTDMSRFLQSLCHKLGVDLLLVTHNPALVEAADKAYKISKLGSAATFKEVTR